MTELIKTKKGWYCPKFRKSTPQRIRIPDEIWEQIPGVKAKFVRDAIIEKLDCGLLKIAIDALDDLIVDAIHLYSYYPNRHRESSEEYFKDAIQTLSKLRGE